MTQLDKPVAQVGAAPAMTLRVGRRVAGAEVANACYFRSGAIPGGRKALLQVTERCDLRCARCFVSATRRGADMRLGDLATALPRLESARVSTVTLTGGEPFVHPDLLELVTLLTGTGVAVTICTNGVSVTTDQIAALRRLPGTSVNVSLDGFSRNSHGRFRGDRDSFDVTVANIRRLGDAGLLKGILCTPNALADPSEFAAIYLFGEEAGAEYVLLNPLSSFGRGIRTRERLRADETEMRRIRHDIEQANQARHGPEPVFIRFPNDSKPLSGCIAGEVVYVFVNGDTAVCPYLAFAVENVNSKHSLSEFIAANLFRDADFSARLDAYDIYKRYGIPSNPSCSSCGIRGTCGNGCPAAVVAGGGRIGDLDAEVCPMKVRS